MVINNNKTNNINKPAEIKHEELLDKEAMLVKSHGKVDIPSELQRKAKKIKLIKLVLAIIFIIIAVIISYFLLKLQQELT